MDTEQLYNMLWNKSPKKVEQILSAFLDETSDEDMQGYNTFDDAEQFSKIWVILKDYNLRSLGVKFIQKLMSIKNDEPTKNKYMMGFANNSEATNFNLNFLGKKNDICNDIINTYTTYEKRSLLSTRG